MEQAGCEGIRRHLSSNYGSRLFIFKKERERTPVVYHSSVFFDLHMNAASIKESSFRGKNSRLCIFSEPTTLFNHLPLCQYSFLPLWKPLQFSFPVHFRCFPVPHMILQTTSDTSKWVLKKQRTSGSAPQKHSNWATVWRARTAGPQDEMPSNAHMLHLPESWATALDVTSSSRRKK